MRKIVLMMVIAVIAPFAVLTSCREYEEPIVTSTDEYELLTTYMKANNLDMANIINSDWVKGASTLGVVTTDGADADTNPDFTIPNYFVMDIRSATDFDAGHINGAVNVASANALSAIPATETRPILVVCYTGQTAARVVGLLRLAGKTAHCLKWGMASWHANMQAKWNTNATNYSSPNWVTTGAPTPTATFNKPVLNTGKTTGEEILKARIEAALAKTPTTEWQATKVDVLANPQNYFVVNRWPQNHWDTYGHISGAYRMSTATEGLSIDGLTKFNPQAQSLVMYCYTGQTSSITTAWLNVLGFDNAKSLMFGGNGIIHSAMLAVPSTDANSVQGSTWQGTNSGWNNNYGYYKTDGTYVAPN